MVNQSSISAYNQEVRSGKIPSQRRRIYDLLMREGPMTNRMIGKVLNMELGSVSGRVNGMITSKLLKGLKEHAPCLISKKRVRWVAVTSPQQMEMKV